MLMQSSQLSKLDLFLGDSWSYFSDGKGLLHEDSFNTAYLEAGSFNIAPTLRSLILYISISPRKWIVVPLRRGILGFHAQIFDRITSWRAQRKPASASVSADLQQRASNLGHICEQCLNGSVRNFAIILFSFPNSSWREDAGRYGRPAPVAHLCTMKSWVWTYWSRILIRPLLRSTVQSCRHTESW